ncbi:hypothetical protein FSARC_10096 [Fusarium sarcochroum]|uniref:Uncharacterized protein n=1 Tax=Fusarium sarcochroum TaxID=1208366 RepID=A0A8H4TPN8_9HYPO|nr:hypothetical protein FSARC_10096 [Fusarium sarcochroum]
MRFLAAVSVLLATMAGPALSRPNESRGMNNFQISTSPTPGSTEDDTSKATPGKSDGSLKRFVQETIDQMNSGKLDWNLLVQDTVKVTSNAVVSIDLDSVVKKMARRMADMVGSFVDGISPVDQVVQMMRSALSALIAKVNINTMLQMSVNMMGSFISLLDFDSTMRMVFEYVNGLL